ncbi:MAG: beta strand repeat-containing protein [Gammaproteobacteria bacterium]
MSARVSRLYRLSGRRALPGGCAALLCVLAFGTPHRAVAADRTWTGACIAPAPSAAWGCAANWAGNVIPGSGDDAIFGLSFLTGHTINLGGTVRHAGNLRINTTLGFSLDNGTLVVSDGGITRDDVNGAEAEHTIDADLLFGTHALLNLNGSNGLAINGDIDTLALGGDFDITKTGNAYLKLGGNNGQFVGDIDFNFGTLYLTGGDNLSDATRLTLSAATLDITAESENFGALAGNGSVKLGQRVLRVGANGDDTTFSGDISGIAVNVPGFSGVVGSLVKAGGGRMTLHNSDNLHPDSTVIEGGTLNLGNGNALGNVTVDAHAGTTLEISGTNTLKAVTGSGAIRINGGGELTLANGAAATLNNAVSGAGTLRKGGAGSLLINTSNIGHTGDVVVAEGVLVLGHANAVVDRAPQIDVGAMLDLNGFTKNLDGFSGNGKLRLGTTGGLTLGNVDTLITGDIGNAPADQGSATLTKFGATTVQLHRATATSFADFGWQGGTFISGGILATDSRSIGGPIEIGSGAQLLFDQAFDATMNASIGGPGVLRKVGSGAVTQVGAGLPGSFVSRFEMAGGAWNLGTGNAGEGAIMTVEDLVLSSGTIAVKRGGGLVLAGTFTGGGSGFRVESGGVLQFENIVLSAANVLGPTIRLPDGSGQLNFLAGTRGNVRLLSGPGASGNVTIDGGSQLSQSNIFIAVGWGEVPNQVGSLGTLQVNGADSSLQVLQLIAGLEEGGRGRITVANGGFIDVLDDLEIGMNGAARNAANPAQGQLVVRGAGSRVRAGFLVAGGNGDFSDITIEDGGLLETGFGALGTQGTGYEARQAMRVTGPGTRWVNGTWISIENGDLRVDDGALIETATMTIGDVFDAQLVVAPRVLLNGGSIAASDGVTVVTRGLLGGSGSIIGDLTVSADARLSPGNSPGLLSIEGDLLLEAGSTTLFEIAGLVPGAPNGYDVVDVQDDAGTGAVEGAATLAAGAVFDIDLVGGFMPTLGQSFDLLLADLVVADRTSLVFDFADAALDAGLFWRSRIVALGGRDALRLSVVASPVPLPPAFGLLGGAMAFLILRRARRAGARG